MNKYAKIFLNVILVLTLVSSFVWGTIVRGLANFGTRAYSVWWNDDIFWANVCQIAIPISIIILLIFINKKRQRAQV